METSRNIVGIGSDRTKGGVARRRIVVAGLALAIAAVVAPLGHADTSSAPPVSQCTDFACQG